MGVCVRTLNGHVWASTSLMGVLMGACSNALNGNTSQSPFPTKFKHFFTEFRPSYFPLVSGSNTMRFILNTNHSFLRLFSHLKKKNPSCSKTQEKIINHLPLSHLEVIRKHRCPLSRVYLGQNFSPSQHSPNCFSQLFFENQHQSGRTRKQKELKD